MKRNLYTVWLDYRKAFDSIPRSWLIRTLKLAKVAKHVTTTTENLTKPWFTKLQLNGQNESITSDLMRIMKGIYQAYKNLSIIHVFNKSK